MKVIEGTPQNFIVVTIFDPVPLETVSIDNIKSQTAFDSIAYIEKEAVMLKDNKGHIESSFQSTRLSFVDKNTTEFPKREIIKLINLLKSLPTLSVRALGVNLFLSIKIGDGKNAAEFIREAFLSERINIRKTFQNSIISNSTRIFYGEPEKYYDLRLTPLNFTGPELSIQLHNHYDKHIVDIEMLSETIKKMLNDTNKELNRLLKVIFSV